MEQTPKEFYKQLRFAVQSLDTLGRLVDVKGNVRFENLLRELKKWTEINPVEENVAEKGAINQGICKSKQRQHVFSKFNNNWNLAPEIHASIVTSETTSHYLHKGHK